MLKANQFMFSARKQVTLAIFALAAISPPVFSEDVQHIGANDLAETLQQESGGQRHSPEPTSVPVINSKQLPHVFARESDKAPIFRDYANSATHLAVLAGMNSDEVEFCEHFGEDLRVLRDIHFVEPIARGKTIEDPKLMVYWPKCRALEPNTLYLRPDDEYTNDVYGTPRYYRSSDVDIYIANIDNDQPPEERYVLFSKGICAHHPPASYPNYPQYTECLPPRFEILNSESCTLEYAMRGYDTYESHQPLSYGLSTLIEYKEKVWSLNIEDISQNLQSINLSRIIPKPDKIVISDKPDKIPEDLLQVCLFHRIDEKNGERQ